MTSEWLFDGAEFITKTIVGPKLIQPPFLTLFESKYPALLQSIVITFQGSPKTRIQFKAFSRKENRYKIIEVSPEFLDTLGMTSKVGSFPYLSKSDEDTNIHTIIYEPQPKLLLSQVSSSHPSLVISIHPDTSQTNTLLYFAVNLLEIYNVEVFIDSIKEIFGDFQSSNKGSTFQYTDRNSSGESSDNEYIQKLIKKVIEKLNELEEKEGHKKYNVYLPDIELEFDSNKIPAQKKIEKETEKIHEIEEIRKELKRHPPIHLVKEKYGLESFITLLKEMLKKYDTETVIKLLKEAEKDLFDK